MGGQAKIITSNWVISKIQKYNCHSHLNDFTLALTNEISYYDCQRDIVHSMSQRHTFGNYLNYHKLDTNGDHLGTTFKHH